MMCVLHILKVNFEDAVDSEFDSEREALRHYSHVIRHYTTRILESPNLWDGCPFVLVRVSERSF